MIFKTLKKKLTRVPCPCIIVLAIAQDRERKCETVRDRTRPCETVGDRTRPYIQPHMKSTLRVSSTVSISYINRME